MAYTTINKSTDYFNTKLWTGTGSSGAKGVTGVGFQPDFLWIKNRSASQEHWLADAVRGTTKFIESNSSNAESSDGATGLASFDSDGFTLGTGSNRTNQSGSDMVAWNWKAGGGQGSSNTDGSINTTYTSVNTTAGFSISQYTGTGATATIGHDLGVVPKMIIIKQTNTTRNWVVGHDSIGWTKYLYLDSTNAQGTGNLFNDTAPTNQVFSVVNDGGVNASGGTYIAYCFAEKTGYSKMGSFIGNGNADGTFAYLGFRPAFILVRASNLTTNWHLYDNKRDPINPADTILRANSSNVDATNSEFAYDFVSNGFKARSSGSEFNGSGNTFIYYAVGQSLVGSNNVPCTAR